jgi:ubiquinone/menaquinone biosynthesis C-methylase UbiE
MMGWYERHVLPTLLDLACGMKVVEKQRAKVVPEAHGDVLEVGLGSGLNLPFYDRSRLRSLVGLEPSEPLREIATRRAREQGIELRLLDAGAEEIPERAGSFDTVVITYTLCTIPEVERALAEVRRVLRPDGRLLFSEHGAAPDARVLRWQHRINPLWRRLAGGCNLDRNVPLLLARAGFRVDRLAAEYLPGLRVLTFTTWGMAARVDS